MPTFATGQPTVIVLDERRAQVESSVTSGPQYYKVHGEIQVTGAGECQARIVFPVRFVDKPLPHFGGELGYGSPTATLGSYPTYSTTVHAWDYRMKPDGSFLYVGALFGVVTTGQPSQVMNIHWSVEGLGLRNPSEN